MEEYTYCTCYFESIYAYLVNNLKDTLIDKIYIHEYLGDEKLQNEIKTKSKFLVCMNKNELTKYESEQKNQYFFRHKSAKYMTMWHKNWQDEFIDNEIHIGDRYADAIVNNIVLEFQHSEIDQDLVIKRQLNYTNHNKELFWIIDCTNDCIKVKKLGDIYQIKFNKYSVWKYKKFISHDFIFLDYLDPIDNTNKMFKINPNHVKTNMIDVVDYHTKSEFIKHLKQNTFNKLYIYDEIPQTTLYFNQRGAGCGKTYESIQLLQNNDTFANIKTFIYLTKVHSAVHVIYSELMDQFNSNKLNIKINKRTKNNKQYLIDFNVYDKKCQIIMGTIDSFVYALGDGKNHIDNSNNFFNSITRKIRDGSVDFNYGCKSYGGINVDLSKECLVVIDEAQDLEPCYVEAMSTIMRSTYINVYVIGDKLQSLANKNNTHTFLETNELPNTYIKRNTGENIVRRFHNHHFIDFVNTIVKFNKFELPSICGICDGSCKYKHKTNIPYEIFGIEPGDDINKSIELIISKIDDEVNKYNYLPNNFMFIFPILQNNPFANRLEAEIQKYWINKFNDIDYRNNVLAQNDFWKKYINVDEYIQFVYLHRSVQGKPINLNESENATRILTIHASKGNGCEVVFLLGVSEKTLKIFSKYNGTYYDKDDIIYESLLHVALTRQKEKLYVGLSNFEDDIALRFEKYIDENVISIIPDLSDIKPNYCFSKLLEQISNNFDCNLLNNCIGIGNIKNLLECDKLQEKEKNNNIIDWGHHIIRYHVFYYYMIYNIHNTTTNVKNDACKNSQIIAIMKKFANAGVISTTSKKFFEYLKENSKKNEINKITNDDNDENFIIPILKFYQKTDLSKQMNLTKTNSQYKNYEEIILNVTKNVQKKIINSINQGKLPLLCPFEIIILFYGIFAIQHGTYSDITIMNIYNIINCYDECSSELDDDHEKDYNCSCKKHFKSGNNNNSDTYSDIRKSITEFHKKTEQVNETFNNFKKLLKINYNMDVTNFHYNLDYAMRFNGQSDQFKIWNIYNLIAQSKDYCLYFIIKPQLNKLNFNQTIFEIIYNVYFLSNVDKNTEAYLNYGNKQIIICIFTLDSTDPILFSVNINKEFMIQIQGNIKKYILDDLTQKHKTLEKFNKFCKKNGHVSFDVMKEKYKYIPKYIEKLFEDLKDKEFEDDELLNKLNKKLNLRIDEYFKDDMLCNSIILETDTCENALVLKLDSNYDNSINQDDIMDYDVKENDEFIDDEFIDDEIIYDEIIDKNNFEIKKITKKLNKKLALIYDLDKKLNFNNNYINLSR